MNRLTDLQKRLIVLGIGLLLILFGAVQGIFKLDIFVKHKRIVDDVTLILMMLAAILLFSKRKPQPEPESPKEAIASEKTEATTGVQTKESD